MTLLFHTHDGDGAPGVSRPAPAVHVRGGVGHTRVDLDELWSIESRLDDVRRQSGNVESALRAARTQLAFDASWAPREADAADATLAEALHGWWGVERLAEEIFEVRMAVRYAAMHYREAEEAAQWASPAPSFLATLWSLGNAREAVIDVAVSLSRVGRIPGWEPAGPVQWLAWSAAEGINALYGDDSLPPDGIALDQAVREFGNHAQYVVPWFLLPPAYVYDGRDIVRDELTPTQRIAIPLVQYFHAITGRGDDLSLTVGPQRPVEPATDLAAVVDSLHAIHEDRGVSGTVEIRRTDHPDGRRSWTVLLPSTQAMLPGGTNPVDNLTNLETYGGLVSDVEIGAARAMELAGIAPGEEVAVVGFSQGGLVGMRLAADPLVRARYRISTVVTAGSPVAHLPTPAGTEVLHLEHLEDPIIGLDGTSNPAEPARTTVSRSLATGTPGELDFRISPAQSHSVAGYARTAELALAAAEPSVVHLSERLAAVTGPPGAQVTATAYRLERG